MKLFLLHAAYERMPDHEYDRQITLIAKTTDGATAYIIVDQWYPFGFLRIPALDVQSATSSSQGYYCDQVKRKLRDSKCFPRSAEVVKRKQFVGFTNLREQHYVMLRFNRWPVWGCRDLNLSNNEEDKGLLEGDVKAVNKFYHETGLRSGAWFEVPDYCVKTFPDGELPPSRCKTHIECHYRLLTPHLEDTTPAPLTIMAYDLETSGLDTDKCSIYQVCLIFWNTGQPIPEVREDPRSVVICTQDTSSVKGTNVIVVANEKELLLQMRQHILDHDPDALTGYNLTFDNKFLFEKLKLYGDSVKHFVDVGRICGVPSYFKESTLASSALGVNERCLWQIPGRAVIDLFGYAKANFVSLPDFKLNTVAEIFLHDNKVDMPFGKIFDAFATKDAVDLRGEVAYYCAIDGRLCNQLMKHWSAHVSCLEEAAISAMNFCDISTTGRQCKVVSLVQSEIFREYVFNTPGDAPPGGYQGAMVITPKVGFYNGPTEQVLCLDFASLYPNLMRSHGICPSRYVRPDKPDEVAASQEEGVVIVEHQVGPNKVVQLAQPFVKGDVPVFTRILTKLLEERKRVRRQMKTVTDPDELNVLNCRQMAKKVACNSAYGILGTTSGMLPLPDLAAVTTYQGRCALEFTIKIATEDYSGNVVGGDTDSIFLMIPHPTTVPAEPSKEWIQDRMRYVFQQGEEIANDITERLQQYLGSKFMVLECECATWPLALYRKKNYAGKLWENPDFPNEKMKLKGVVAVRNDWSRITKRMAQDVLRMAIKESNPEGAVQHFRDTLTKMRRGQLPVEDFIIKKQLSTYEPKTISPHVNLALRIRAKDHAAAPPLGTKLQYVFRSGPEELSQRAVLPSDITPDQIDYEYYFERQLLKPIAALLGPMVGGGVGKLHRMLTNEQNNQRDMSQFVSGYVDAYRPEKEVKPKSKVTSADIGAMFGDGVKRAAPEQKKKAKSAKPAKKQKTTLDSFFKAS
ncbi:hypothetical protein JKP88DRAFT_241006 [Tribonema minus]|uniref:DNA polymerase delta catalytic subunit n=1 Tax=Tribonema minus TaxID=303371 RepID=A0A836CH60_9STRA|nr:hypothetical protein JKP88DRAFT_241006 [Tribonema minus]